MTVPASRREKIVGALMVAASIAYLIPYVPRGWIPHDDGMLGQSAERVLRGDIPHVGFEETYMGGLSWLYAAVFKIAGVDLLNLRWVLFAGAAVAVWLVYAITRRYLRPAGAGFAACLALAWSFPNYFAALPSWWLLTCALACLWMLIRHLETQQWRYVIGAGVAAGIAIVIKQTGMYLFLGLMLSLLFMGERTESPGFAAIERALRWASAVVAVVLPSVVLGPRLFGADGVYLLTPVAACAVALAADPVRKHRLANGPSVPALLSVAAAAAAVPVLSFLLPYIIRHHVRDLVYGTLMLPRKRLGFASWPMLDLEAAAKASAPMLGLAFLEFRSRKRSRSTVLTVAMWTAVIALPISALWYAKSYQLVWQFARAAAAVLPIAVAGQVISGQIEHPRKRVMLFASATILSWASLNQFPYAGPVYFLYIAPLAVIAGVAAIDAEPSIRPDAVRLWGLLLLAFAVLVANRSHYRSLGASYAPQARYAALDLPTAHLTIDEREVDVYRPLMSTIAAHLRGGRLFAAPDCPEIYFLSGAPNPTGRIYNFLSGNESDDPGEWLKSDVIVVNHAPSFSPKPADRVIGAVRREFSHGDQFGAFEIRWR